MKKSIIYIPFFITLVAIFSCSKLLEESPKALTVEAFYNTPAEVEAGLAAIYAPLRAQMSGWWIGILESQAEWGVGLQGHANFDPFRSMSGIDKVGENNLVPRWNAFYTAIRNANLVIANAPNGKSLTDDQKNVYLAEARFLRAFTYFQLVRGWGGVPLHTEENLSESAVIPKGSREQVYELITKDLEFAEMHLPDEVPLVGKPSKWAAKTVLADVYFYQALHDKAALKADEVIASGKHSLEKVTVADDFNKVFGMESNSPEEIFYLKYNVSSPSQLILFTQQIYTPWFGSNGYGVILWHDKAKFYTNWNDNDLRKNFNWYKDTISNPFLPDQPEFPRTGVTMLSPKKYNNPTATIETFSLPLYRYADVLLIYAEASAQAAGPTPNSMEKLNMVHRRAYGYDPLQPSPVDYKLADYSTKKAFTDLVIQERGYETQLEGKRWFDLVRSGTVKEVMKNNINRDVADKHLLWPIPTIEFDLNKGLDKTKDQNPGY
ncbi:MAG TPA: RagB/SusD family nutrient uptake outer membrane protein [Segetibacter sp.]|nr:RagB/SusD family nutrient uptake outer membrane protein [Segetibacter sp.]